MRININLKDGTSTVCPPMGVYRQAVAGVMTAIDHKRAMITTCIQIAESISAMRVNNHHWEPDA